MKPTCTHVALFCRDIEASVGVLRAPRRPARGAPAQRRRHHRRVDGARKGATARVRDRAARHQAARRRRPGRASRLRGRRHARKWIGPPNAVAPPASTCRAPSMPAPSSATTACCATPTATGSSSRTARPSDRGPDAHASRAAPSAEAAQPDLAPPDSAGAAEAGVLGAGSGATRDVAGQHDDHLAQHSARGRRGHRRLLRDEAALHRLALQQLSVDGDPLRPGEPSAARRMDVDDLQLELRFAPGASDSTMSEFRSAIVCGSRVCEPHSSQHLVVHVHAAAHRRDAARGGCPCPPRLSPRRRRGFGLTGRAARSARCVGRSLPDPAGRRRVWSPRAPWPVSCGDGSRLRERPGRKRVPSTSSSVASCRFPRSRHLRSPRRQVQWGLVSGLRIQTPSVFHSDAGRLHAEHPCRRFDARQHDTVYSAAGTCPVTGKVEAGDRRDVRQTPRTHLRGRQLPAVDRRRPCCACSAPSCAACRLRRSAGAARIPARALPPGRACARRRGFFSVRQFVHRVVRHQRRQHHRVLAGGRERRIEQRRHRHRQPVRRARHRASQTRARGRGPRTGSSRGRCRPPTRSMSVAAYTTNAESDGLRAAHRCAGSAAAAAIRRPAPRPSAARPRWTPRCRPRCDGRSRAPRRAPARVR